MLDAILTPFLAHSGQGAQGTPRLLSSGGSEQSVLYEFA